VVQDAVAARLVSALSSPSLWMSQCAAYSPTLANVFAADNPCRSSDGMNNTRDGLYIHARHACFSCHTRFPYLSAMCVTECALPPSCRRDLKISWQLSIPFRARRHTVTESLVLQAMIEASRSLQKRKNALFNALSQQQPVCVLENEEMAGNCNK
jgi:hypothetical protein